MGIEGYTGGKCWLDALSLNVKTCTEAQHCFVLTKVSFLPYRRKVIKIHVCTKLHGYLPSMRDFTGQVKTLTWWWGYRKVRGSLYSKDYSFSGDQGKKKQAWSFIKW